MVHDSYTKIPIRCVHVVKKKEENHAVKLPSELEEFGVLSGPDVTLVSFGPC